MKRLNERLEKLESAERQFSGKLHLLFAWESWDQDRVLDDYGRDRIGPNDKVRILVWRDSHLDEPMPYPEVGSGAA